MTGLPAWDTVTSWAAAGQQQVERAAAGLDPALVAEPSRLPGWTRGHVLSHLARNADALVNLLTWARTGVETPMYPSRQARDEDIAATAAQSPADLRADYATAGGRLAEAIETLPPEAWTAQVRTMQGRAVPVTDVPWMRAKEIWVHGVDLSAGLRFADLDPEFCAALVDDVLGTFAGRGEAPDARVVSADVQRTWGAGDLTVEGPVTAVAAWLTRSDASGLSGEVPELPTWL